MLQDNDGVEGEFARLSAHDIMTSDIPTLKSLLADKKEKLEKEREQRRQRRAQSRAERHTHQDVTPAQVCTLEGHDKDVFICAWSPAGSLLASGCVSVLMLPVILLSTPVTAFMAVARKRG